MIRKEKRFCQISIKLFRTKTSTSKKNPSAKSNKFITDNIT